MQPGRASTAGWLLAAAAVLGALAWRFRWLCDDSYISFRYARNLARGWGLVYNRGEDPRVEGYSNLLWVLLLAPFEALDLGAPVVSLFVGAACGLALVLVLGRMLFARVPGRRCAVLALAFAATLPPLACWSTGGLETMPFTLALFGTFAALHAGRPRPVVASLAAVAAVLLRADGALFVAAVAGGSLLVGRSRRDRALSRAALISGAAALAATLVQVAWRRAYYGAWEPNTARAKVALSALVLERGLDYVATFLISFPAVAIALLLCPALLRRPREPVALAALAVVAATFAYSVLVGGDFMAMGRFLVPGLPFLALAFGLALARLPRAVAAVATGACVALSLAMVAGVEPVPRSFRERFEFRHSSEDRPSEFEQWRKMRQQAARWAALGRALALHTAPGESLVLGTVGAVGYHCELEIHDPFGLVSREEFASLDPAEKRSPGHQRRIPIATFLAKRPTYLEAALVPAEARWAMLRPELREGGELAGVARFRWIPLPALPGAPPGHLLRLVRYAPRDG